MLNLSHEAARTFSKVPADLQVETYKLFLLMIGADPETGKLTIPQREHVPRYNLFCLLRDAIYKLMLFDNLEEIRLAIQAFVTQILEQKLLTQAQLDLLIRGLYCDIDP